MRYVTDANLLGMPAISVPAGHDSAGVPVLSRRCVQRFGAAQQAGWLEHQNPATLLQAAAVSQPRCCCDRELCRSATGRPADWAGLWRGCTPGVCDNAGGSAGRALQAAEQLAPASVAAPGKGLLCAGALPGHCLCAGWLRRPAREVRCLLDPCRPHQWQCTDRCLAQRPSRQRNFKILCKSWLSSGRSGESGSQWPLPLHFLASTGLVLRLAQAVPGPGLNLRSCARLAWPSPGATSFQRQQRCNWYACVFDASAGGRLGRHWQLLVPGWAARSRLCAWHLTLGRWSSGLWGCTAGTEPAQCRRQVMLLQAVCRLRWSPADGRARGSCRLASCRACWVARVFPSRWGRLAVRAGPHRSGLPRRPGIAAAPATACARGCPPLTRQSTALTSASWIAGHVMASSYEATEFSSPVLTGTLLRVFCWLVESWLGRLLVLPRILRQSGFPQVLVVQAQERRSGPSQRLQGVHTCQRRCRPSGRRTCQSGPPSRWPGPQTRLPRRGRSW